MAITRVAPQNQVMLIWNSANKRGSSSGDTLDGSMASGAIRPGDIIEPVDDSGVNKWQKFSTENEEHSNKIALERGYLNEGLTDNYADGEMVDWYPMEHGDEFYGFLASGEDVANGGKLECAASGEFAAADLTTAASGLAKFTCIDNPSIVASAQRIRIRYDG